MYISPTHFKIHIQHYRFIVYDNHTPTRRWMCVKCEATSMSRWGMIDEHQLYPSSSSDIYVCVQFYPKLIKAYTGRTDQDLVLLHTLSFVPDMV